MSKRKSTFKKFRLDLSEFDPSVEGFHKITREWFENNIMDKLTLNPNNNLISEISEFSFKLEGCKSYCNIDYVFLAGGTCRIPYVQNTIRKVFSDLDPSRIVIDPELEIITAQGALIHGCLVKRKLERPIIVNTQSMGGNDNMRFPMHGQSPLFSEKSLLSTIFGRFLTNRKSMISAHLCDPNFDCTYPETNDNENNNQ
uniref:Uncharacterized protein n=1 Tax=Panagrolaimus sp. JU765 TaxID=591449 RepID=A0AC34RMC9_9BILA